MPIEQMRLELVLRGQISRGGEGKRQHASTSATTEAGLWADAREKASYRVGDSSGSMKCTELWHVLIAKQSSRPNEEGEKKPKKPSHVAGQGSKEQKQHCLKMAEEIM
jgi:hypothetical protein